MKILIISDSHDNIVRLRHVIGFAKTEGFAAVIHCGDWNTPLAISEISKVGIKIYGVLGNADINPQMEQQLFEVCENFDPDFLSLNLDELKIGVCHYPAKLDAVIESQEYDVLFCGHTHIKKHEYRGKTQIINPGALHRTLSPSFGVFETETKEVEIVNVAI